MNTVSEFHAEAPQTTLSKGLPQGPYVATRAGFEPEPFGQRIYKWATTPHNHLLISILH